MGSIFTAYGGTELGLFFHKFVFLSHDEGGCWCLGLSAISLVWSTFLKHSALAVNVISKQT